ncbi:MAG: hypothetical protein QF546_08495 [Alphaproteobacteria bacterium]|nr:hypothetical protein [Alphaproteobacteria bacterium]MDP7603860.1 hypothetical protein [Alphaproteobacteria bacterium]HJP22499.1 hypothetical protein [Alphaproteobacteria bacterium]
MLRRHRGVYAALLTALLLAGCAPGGLLSKQTNIPCPSIMLLGEAERLTQFKEGEGRDLIDVRYEATLSNLTLQCVFKEGRVEVIASFDLVATRGPAARGRIGEFPFFVAVTGPGPGDGIMAKEVFSSRLEFGPNRRRAGVVEQIEEIIPLAEGQKAEDFEVLIGFQLAPDQLEYNRRRRGR